MVSAHRLWVEGTDRGLNVAGLRVDIKLHKVEHLGFEDRATCLEVRLMALCVQLLVQFRTTPVGWAGDGLHRSLAGKFAAFKELSVGSAAQGFGVLQSVVSRFSDALDDSDTVRSPY